MANIIDYILNKGDTEISKEHPFNEIDSMILARFSYLLFEKIEMSLMESISSISNKMKDFDNSEFKYNGDKALITALGNSIRFKNMIVTDYVQNSDIEIEKQFSAITIHISDYEMYISYEGTDKTINGWKEDFNLAFLEKIPAQIAGKDYAIRVMEKYPHKEVRIGGHSKGGNITMYTAISIPEKFQNRIIKISNYDGPGFGKNIIEKYEKNQIWNKVTTYIPQDSVIGRLLCHKGKSIVVYSIEKGIYQHDIYSWQITDNQLETMNELTDSSELINSALTEWLENTNTSQRQMFFDLIFEILYAADVTSTVDIKRTLIKKTPELFLAYKEVSEEDRKIIADMVKVFIKSYVSKIKENETEKLLRFPEKFEHRKNLDSSNDGVQN